MIVVEFIKFQIMKDQTENINQLTNKVYGKSCCVLPSKIWDNFYYTINTFDKDDRNWQDRSIKEILEEVIKELNNDFRKNFDYFLNIERNYNGSYTINQKSTNNKKIEKTILIGFNKYIHTFYYVGYSPRLRQGTIPLIDFYIKGEFYFEKIATIDCLLPFKDELPNESGLYKALTLILMNYFSFVRNEEYFNRNKKIFNMEHYFEYKKGDCWWQ